MDQFSKLTEKIFGNTNHKGQSHAGTIFYDFKAYN